MIHHFCSTDMKIVSLWKVEWMILHFCSVSRQDCYYYSLSWPEKWWTVSSSILVDRRCVTFWHWLACPRLRSRDRCISWHAPSSPPGEQTFCCTLCNQRAAPPCDPGCVGPAPLCYQIWTGINWKGKKDQEVLIDKSDRSTREQWTLNDRIDASNSPDCFDDL